MALLHLQEEGDSYDKQGTRRSKSRMSQIFKEKDDVEKLLEKQVTAKFGGGL